MSVLPPAIRRAIVAHARSSAPRECCGFLVGRGRRIHHAVPMTNVARGHRRYRVSDREHLELRRVLRTFVPPLEIVGVYHSHPNGDAVPSETDRAEAFYPDWLYLVVGLGSPRVQLRAFRIRHGRVREQPLT